MISFLALLVAMSGTAVALTKNSVGPKQLQKNAVRSKHVKANQVATKHIKDGAVTEAKLAEGIEGLQGPIGPKGDEGPRGVPGSDATIDGVEAGGDLAGTYPNPEIAQDAIGSAEVADDSLTGADIDESSLGKVGDADTLDGSDSTDFVSAVATAGGDLSGPFSNLQIAAGSVGQPEIATDGVGASEIATNAVGSSEIADNAVASSEIADNSVGVAELNTLVFNGPVISSVSLSAHQCVRIGAAFTRAGVSRGDLVIPRVTNDTLPAGLDAVPITAPVADRAPVIVCNHTGGALSSSGQVNFQTVVLKLSG